MASDTTSFASAVLRFAHRVVASAALAEQAAYEAGLREGSRDGFLRGYHLGQEHGYVAATAGHTVPDIQREIKARDAWLAQITRNEPTPTYSTPARSAEEITSGALASWGLTPGTRQEPAAAREADDGAEACA